MAAPHCWRRCSVSFHFLRSYLPTARTKGRFSLTRSPNSCLVSKPKSSNDPTMRKGSKITQAPDRRTYDCVAECCRRLAKDWENLNCNALAFLKLASIRLMLRKL